MKRSDGAKAWSTVLSELAQVKVSVGWERPTWRVSLLDGPTREALMGRAAALGRYRVGAPLPFADGAGYYPHDSGRGTAAVSGPGVASRVADVGGIRWPGSGWFGMAGYACPRRVMLAGSRRGR